MLKKKSLIVLVLVLIISILLTTFFELPSYAEDGDDDTTSGKEIWEEAEIEDLITDPTYMEKYIDTLIYKKNLYITEAVFSEKETPEVIIQSYKYVKDTNKWEAVGSSIHFETEVPVSTIKLGRHSNGLFIFVGGYGYIKIYKLDETTNEWIDKATAVDTTGAFNITTDGIKTYIATINQNTSAMVIVEFDGENATEKTVDIPNAGYIIEPKIAILNDTIYIGVIGLGASNITMFSYSGTLQPIDVTIAADSFEMQTLRERIYITTTLSSGAQSSSGLNIYTFNGSSWETIQTNVSYGTPKMCIKENEVYLLSTNPADEETRVYGYSKTKKEFRQEGNDIDEVAYEGLVVVYNEEIYTIYLSADTYTGELKLKTKKKVFVADYFRGDINQDGRVSVSDINAGIRGLSDIGEFTDEQRAIGDVTDDGRFSITDINKICMYLGGTITDL